MYKFTVFDNSENKDIRYLGYNGSGQAMILELARYTNEYNNVKYWYIAFHVSNKRKHKFKYKEQTGTDGIKSLLWAKDCLKDFIENQIDKRFDNHLIIYWDDKRRKEVYKRALTELGFFITKDYGKDCLLLKVKKV